MRVAIPHSLPRDEVRRRIHDRSGELIDVVPGGMAKVETEWLDDDTMDLAIKAMGHSVTGAVNIEDNQIVVSLDLPAQLGFFGSVVENAIREKGMKLLA